nr:putative PEP-binding protein [Aquibium microcysteis]
MASPASIVASSLASGGSPVSITATKPCPVRAPIGLCRSEMQILASSEAPSFIAYLAAIAEGRRPELPGNVATRLETSLEQLLSASDGTFLNYRLMDADLGEVLAGTSVSGATSLRGVRGPRWALESGFYAWQIEMAVCVAERQRMARRRVDLALTLPSAFDLAEVRATRRLFDAALEAHPQARRLLRFGVMIETPRLCAQAEQLRTLAEVFCFGLNDLTALLHGLERNAWAKLEAFYAANGLAAADPFSELDPIAVEPLVLHTIEKLRRSGAVGPMFLCGEPANSRSAHELAAGSQNLFVSVSEGDWPSAVLSCARERFRAEGAPALAADCCVERTGRFSRRAAAAARAGDTGLAAKLALEWLSGAAPLASDDATRNWKVLKKWLVAAMFGELHGRFVAPGWDPADVAAYASELLGGSATIRISAFPSGISCHARSEVFEHSWNKEELIGYLDGFDRAAALHVFPQQHADQLCFRAVFTSEEIVVEAGWGQAMYVFEAERGKHSIVTARAAIEGPFQIDESAGDLRVRRGLQALIAAKDHWLHGVARSGPALLGLEHFAIEAYFDPREPDRVAVVDMDLPLDVAWNTGATSQFASLGVSASKSS